MEKLNSATIASAEEKQIPHNVATRILFALSVLKAAEKSLQRAEVVRGKCSNGVDAVYLDLERSICDAERALDEINERAAILGESFTAAVGSFIASAGGKPDFSEYRAG